VVDRRFLGCTSKRVILLAGAGKGGAKRKVQVGPGAGEAAGAGEADIQRNEHQSLGIEKEQRAKLIADVKKTLFSI